VLHKIRSLSLKRTKEEFERRCEQYEIQLQAQAKCKDQEILAKLNLISYLNGAAEQARHEIQSLRRQLANETEEKRNLKTASDRLESKAKSQASHFEFEIESLRNQLAKETEEKRNLERACEKLEKQVAAQTKKAKFDSSFRAACGEKIAELSERNSELRMEKANLKGKLDAANEQIELKSQICKTLEEI
jgi:chromosome segregation ATPase